MVLSIGMAHEEVKNKLKQYSEPHRNQVKSSMINQVKLAEGEGSANALKKEIDHLGWRGGCDTNFINSKSMAVTCNICLKDCKNRGTSLCESCFKFDNFVTKEGV